MSENNTVTKNNNSQTMSKNSNHKICLDNRQDLTVSGVTRVDNINPNIVTCKIGDTQLTIQGSDLYMDKLDLSSGVIEVSGRVDSIRYSVQKPSLIKRIFK